jgi:hypothetical protein
VRRFFLSDYLSKKKLHHNFSLFLLAKLDFTSKQQIDLYILYSKTMIRISLILFTTFFTSLIFSQNYWQQEVNYTIEVRLDDENHALSASEKFQYVNNSPDALDFMYVHLWPNAYNNEKTALGKQQYESGKTLLKYGNDSIKGRIDSLDFKVNGQRVKWEYELNNPDICKIIFNEPLLAGSKIEVSTPFHVKIPSGEISRLGHVGQSYQITQWYPKPAVYDKNGWNQIPYLNQGEFYSEYGTFDVSITLPKNYVVAATGDLQTKKETAFLKERALMTKDKFENSFFTKEENQKSLNNFPSSDSEYKTIRYTQSRVHDFAWFADKRFEVLTGEVELPQSKRMVTSWAMVTPKNAEMWKNSLEYINDGTYFYSKWNGDYPYNHVTAVDGTISAGGGMEYPNVTVIGNTSSIEELEIVIVHEVGHNWFYGILGSNERVHGWMDEGMNTLNEVRYIQTKYPNNTRLSDMVMGGKFHFNDLDYHDMNDVSYKLIALFGEDQPIETHSADFTGINYGLIMYQKTGLVFFYLKAYLGDSLFDECMHTYYETWKFKHPQPEDMRSTFETVSGKNLSWLFDDLIQTTNHLDYKIKSVKKTEEGYDVKIKNVGQVNGPVGIDLFSKGVKIKTVWVDPCDGTQLVHIKANEIDEVRIDSDKNIPEINRSNNNWNKNWLFNKTEPLKLEFLFGDNEPAYNNHFWTPILAGNYHDKLMVGAAFHNFGIPFNKFQYVVAPMYSFGRKSVSGMGEFSYSFLPKNGLKLTRIGLSLKSFKDDSEFKNNESYFASAAPYVFMKLGNRTKAKPFSQTLLVQTIYNTKHRGSDNQIETGGFIKYTFNYATADHKFNLTLRNDYLTNVQNSDEFARISAEGIYEFRYLKNKMKRWIQVRAFIGNNYILSASNPTDRERYSLSLSGAHSTQDVFVEEYYLARNINFGLWNQQRNEDMGGFKSTSWYGTTGSWLTSGNIYLQLPIKPDFLGAFADFGAFSNGSIVNGAFNTGLAIRLSTFFGVYFPLYRSENMGDLYTNYSDNIRFTLKLNMVNRGIKLSGLN